MTRHQSISIAILTLGLALGLAACNKTKVKSGDDALPIRAVEVTKVGTHDLVHKVEVLGELEGISEIRVFAQVPERIRAIAVKQGQQVKAGQLIAVLRGELQSEAVTQAEAGLEAANANADALRDQLTRVKALVKAGTASRSQLDSLQAQLNAAEAQVRQVTASLSQASTQKSRTLIRAPIAGVVAELRVHQGDMAAPQVPLCTIVRSDELKAVLRVPEREFLKVKEGMPAVLSPLADPSVTVDAQVTLKGPVVDRMSRTGDVEIHLDNKDGKLVAGSAVRVDIELSRKKDVVMVPASALIFTPETSTTGKALAFVVDPQAKIAHRRDVIIGDRQRSLIEIKQGLKPGDELVTLGAQLLRDKNPVKIVSNDVAGS